MLVKEVITRQHLQASAARLALTSLTTERQPASLAQGLTDLVSAASATGWPRADQPCRRAARFAVMKAKARAAMESVRRLRCGRHDEAWRDV